MGRQETDCGWIPMIDRLAVATPPGKAARISAVWLLSEIHPVAWNWAVVLPAATNTPAGICNPASVANRTPVPFAGAGCDNPSVQVDVAVPTRDVGAQTSEVTDTSPAFG